MPIYESAAFPSANVRLILSNPRSVPKAAWRATVQHLLPASPSFSWSQPAYCGSCELLQMGFTIKVRQLLAKRPFYL